MDVQAVVIEGRQGADGADHDRHGVGVAAEAFEEAIELSVQHRVPRDALLELFVLGRSRQFAVQQEIADLDEVGL